MTIKITPCGAAKGVTGSCYLLEAQGIKLLIDCGLFQGGEEERNYDPFPFDPSEISYLILTHAHIDHCGRIPLLVKEGFKGKILCTRPTAQIARIMLLDAARVMNETYKSKLKKAERLGEVVNPPIYEEMDVLESFDLFSHPYLEYDKFYDLAPAFRFRLKDAGHILGSAFVEFDVGGKRVIFSGDLGNKNKPIVRDPSPPSTAQAVFIETTYGDRNHKSFKESKEEFEDAVLKTLYRGGNVLIPSYALERAQDILFVLREMYERDILPECQVFLDSPLAISATKLFLQNPDFFDEETYRIFKERDPFNFPYLKFTRDVEESKKINDIKSGAIIIAGSGMLTGGRILHHLKHNLWREECSLIFVGYQPKGTLGRRIIEGSEKVKVLGEEIAVRAEIYTINGFSSHAGQKELTEWLSHTERPKVYLVHGEEEKMNIFADHIKNELSLESFIPEFGMPIEI
ncbi:metallo-beta-lactamase family protein [Hydrogenivirga caldilitoris]|uniref:Metallo-beta-lactamase family protein n=1 Tax=Hydrogenivirga caldilitoris TaxID=246264 RepID=A0A497XTH7_9AQUI|nr:MBL fold metallo-hydrolase [Hydrogenivirga caldilitoris]RLJ71604.1 metallo-beta-lactamase family protein [Hydrogenivirga caldilitoris]